jgi:hypothetical protein
MQAIVFTTLCVLSLVSESHAWSGLEHKAVAEVAQEQLTSSANAKLAKLLKDGSKLTPGRLAQLSTWQDEIRTIARGGASPPEWSYSDLEEAKQFNLTYPENGQWHFVDVPMGANRYPDLEHPDDQDPTRLFIKDHDVVHQINHCVAILEAEDNLGLITKTQAVRWLIHLVADIHQPLHVISGYYDPASDLQHPVIIRDPKEAAEVHAVNDREGIGLLFSAFVNIHGVWDDCVVRTAMAMSCSADVTEEAIEKLASRLKAEVNKPASKPYKSTGNHHGWPERWATDTLKQAGERKILDLQLEDGVVQSHGGEEYMQAKINTVTKQAYMQKHKDLAIAQLTRAGVRLAQLLNNIDWK